MGSKPGSQVSDRDATMLIDGARKFGVVRQPDRPGYEVQVTFVPEFRVLDLTGQAAAFRDYGVSLGRGVPTLGQGDSNRARMLLAQQSAAQMLPS